MDGMLDYERATNTNEAIARFGTLKTREGTYEMPTVSPLIRTRTDVEAVVENFHGGMRASVITPQASRARIIGSELERVLGSGNRQVPWKRPLVLGDVEAESLSINCTARKKYEEDSDVGEVLGRLLSTGLTGDRSAGRYQCHRAWREVERKFSFIPLAHWAGDRLAAVHSDVFMLPLPIARADLSTVRQALQTAERLVPVARNMNDYATFGHVFSHFGLSLPIHADLFGQDESARDARAALINGVQSWNTEAPMQALFLGLKIYDPSNRVLGGPEATAERQSLSELVSNLRTAVEMAGGMLVMLDEGERTLGMLDSGADVVASRVTGDDWIERPIANANPSTGPRPPPDLLDPVSLDRRDWEEWKQAFEATGSFRTPSCVEPKPFWDDSWTERRVYEGRIQTGVYHDLGETFRETGIQDGTSIRETLEEQLEGSSRHDELLELCPSLA